MDHGYQIDCIRLSTDDLIRIDKEIGERIAHADLLDEPLHEIRGKNLTSNRATVVLVSPVVEQDFGG